MKIALLQPGEMGAAIGRTLVAAGQEVGVGLSRALGGESRERAEAAGLVDRGDLAALLADSELVLSICPPHAAPEVAAEVAGTGFAGTYLDCNAIAPSTAAQVRATVIAAGATFVDGGIIGGPPSDDNGPRLYLSGATASEAAALFDDTVVEAIVLDQGPFAASQIKMAYAAWSKGRLALLLTAMAAARRSGLDGPLTAEWAHSQPGLAELLRAAEAADDKKGWRWIGEMEEIARSMEDLGLPDGFHRAAAAVYAADDIP